MSKKILFAVIFSLAMSATVAVARAEPATKVAKATKKNPAPEPKKDDKDKRPIVGALRDKNDIEIVAGPDVSVMSGVMKTQIKTRWVVLAIED